MIGKSEKFLNAFAAIGKDRKATPAGDEWQPEYEMRIVDGLKRVVKSDRQVNLREAIQEYLEETKIENIIRRAIGGDANALDRNTGIFGDFTDAPTSLAEAQKILIQAESEWEKLSKETRGKFGFSFEAFIQSWGSEEWAEKMKQPEIIQKVEEKEEKAE